MKHSLSLCQKADDIMFLNTCGCYSCLKIFSPSFITETTLDDATNEEIAVCPFCNKATVVSNHSDSIDDKTLKDIQMNNVIYSLS
jgi:hypothetical protein